MRKRINTRDENFAKVSADKAEADAMQMSGLFYMYSYFDKDTRKEHKIALDENDRWIYEKDSRVVPDGKYMYAVGQNGALYMGNPTVHSQFKAGKDTQSAGWIEYHWDKDANVIIDNCSGHYTPTLSQFLITLHGLHAAGVLPDQFQLKLSKFTELDYDSINQKFWQDVVINSQAQANDAEDETALLTVAYSAKENGFIFSKNAHESLTMTEKEIFNYRGKAPSPR